LLVGVTGFVVDDPERRAAIVTELGEALPPLKEFLEIGLAEAGRGAVSFSALGLVALIWGASRFYVALDEAFARVFVEGPRRGVVSRTVRGVLGVGGLVAAYIAAILVTGGASLIEEIPLAGSARDLVRLVARIGSPLVAATAFSMGVTVVYRLVPTRRSSWREVLPPGVAAGVALAVFTGLFAYVAPRLVGTLAVFGAFFAVFAALVWLSVGFQVLLLGAAWLRIRMEHAAPSGEATH
jgi:membrane protein